MGESVVIHAVLPVGVVVVNRIKQIVGVFVHEGRNNRIVLEIVLTFLSCSQEFRNVVAVLVGIHHSQLRRGQLVATVSANVDSSYHALTTLGGDFNHTVTTLGTIERRTILDDLDIGDVFWVENVEDVVNETCVERCTIVLHIPNHSIDNHQRL